MDGAIAGRRMHLGLPYRPTITGVLNPIRTRRDVGEGSSRDLQISAKLEREDTLTCANGCIRTISDRLDALYMHCGPGTNVSKGYIPASDAARAGELRS